MKLLFLRFKNEIDIPFQKVKSSENLKLKMKTFKWSHEILIYKDLVTQTVVLHCYS